MEQSPEEMLKERLGDGCEDAIARKMGEFGGLLSRNAAVVLLCRQNGIDLEKRISLCGAKRMALPFSFQAKVDRIFPVQEYPGSGNRSVRLHISDAGGEATLVLWNEQANAVKGEISIGDMIECRGAYFKGGEIGIGKNGAMKKEKGFPISKIPELSYGLCNVEGVVEAVEPDHHHRDRKTGVEKRLPSFSICGDGACRRVVMWHAEGAKNPSAGDVILLENVFFKDGELNFDAFSRMVKRKAANERFGEFGEASVEGESVVFTIGGEKYSASLQEALLLLKIRSAPPGVGPQALISMKSRELEGKNVLYILDGEKLALLEVE